MLIGETIFNHLQVNTMFILLEKGKIDRMHDAHLTPICYALVADSSASVNLQLWYELLYIAAIIHRPPLLAIGFRESLCQ